MEIRKNNKKKSNVLNGILIVIVSVFAIFLCLSVYYFRSFIIKSEYRYHQMSLLLDSIPTYGNEPKLSVHKRRGGIDASSNYVFSFELHDSIENVFDFYRGYFTRNGWRESKDKGTGELKYIYFIKEISGKESKVHIEGPYHLNNISLIYVRVEVNL